MKSSVGFLVGVILDVIRTGGFFFQAEDGIRDLVRSRGLGDVYKRQEPGERGPRPKRAPTPGGAVQRRQRPGCRAGRCRAVSYTHLTLPTSDLV